MKKNSYLFNDPYLELVEQLNERKMPRYHVYDGKELEIIDIEEKYPNEKLILIYNNGYVYVGNVFGDRYFMSMHFASDIKEEAEAYIEWLKNRRQVNLKDFLD